MERALAGAFGSDEAAASEALADEVDAWHDGLYGSGMPLATYLGMTRAEYARWAKDGSCLGAILAERVKNAGAVPEHYLYRVVLGLEDPTSPYGEPCVYVAPITPCDRARSDIYDMDAAGHPHWRRLGCDCDLPREEIRRERVLAADLFRRVGAVPPSGPVDHPCAGYAPLDTVPEAGPALARWREARERWREAKRQLDQARVAFDEAVAAVHAVSLSCPVPPDAPAPEAP